MRPSKIIFLLLCALAACGDDVSLGSQDGGGRNPDGDGGVCTGEASPSVALQCGNIQCDGASQYCSASTWPDPCKPLPCECASAPPSQQSCECLMQHIVPSCDAGATCTNEPSGLVVRCKASQ